MAFTEYELVVLDNGEVALQRAGSNEPLVRINFSPAVLEYLGGKHVQVAKSMVDAGIKTVFEHKRAYRNTYVISKYLRFHILDVSTEFKKHIRLI